MARHKDYSMSPMGKPIFRSSPENNLGVDYHPGTQKVLFGNEENNIALAEWRNGTLTNAYETEAFALRRMQFSQNGKKILRGDSTLWMINAETGEELWKQELEGITGIVPHKWNETDGIIEVIEQGFPNRIQLLAELTGEPVYEEGNSQTGFGGNVEGGRHSVYSNSSGSTILINHTSLQGTPFTHEENQYVHHLRVLGDTTTVLGITTTNPYDRNRTRLFY